MVNFEPRPRPYSPPPPPTHLPFIPPAAEISFLREVTTTELHLQTNYAGRSALAPYVNANYHRELERRHRPREREKEREREREISSASPNFFPRQRFRSAFYQFKLLETHLIHLLFLFVRSFATAGSIFFPELLI